LGELNIGKTELNVKKNIPSMITDWNQVCLAKKATRCFQEVILIFLKIRRAKDQFETFTKSEYGAILEGDDYELQVSNFPVATSQSKKVLEIFFVFFILP
jgi:hypothetical protein